MPRVPHKSYPLDFPVYSLTFISPHLLILGGGGGSSSNSGVKNKLGIYSITQNELNLKLAYELDNTDDCPMSLNVPLTNKHYLLAGINSNSEVNENCRLFSIDQQSDQINQIHAKQTIFTNDVTCYQRVAHFSNASIPVLIVDGKSTEKSGSQLHAFSYPDMNPVLRDPLQINGDILNVTFNSDSSLLAVATPTNVLIFTFSVDNKEGKIHCNLNLSHTINHPALPKPSSPSPSFRHANFGRGAHTNRLYTITNSPPPHKKKAARPSFLTAWDVSTWSVVRSVTLADKPITACDLSEDGQLIAFASADLSLGIVSAKTLAPLVRILSAHSFPVTCLSFDPTATVLASGSPDNSVRLIQVPQDLAAGDSARAFVHALVIAILIALLAVLLQLYQKK
ncbi:hypothetical protein E3P89_01175 [Wallemia ichthyophaga]|uniref:Guanine nucleotide-exchange factor SEC12 n=1 Tax=Wallemia ichthyophaga TaxID=245174 RepID=A0A4T0HGD5_WALIC|nr:hypothetical protein E3P90_01576 [Wallemia ichthyophaga]TIB15239.1 hypothetical protein E3P93_01326 [Wallemia ichthyophaga]TIB24025.1 hypothetical protein E3P89_01175 [Wallemia ichthyophaga]TIB25464.1 hypothetical protein E3P88_01530 [Wallemia ichthyophaga]TIB34850.1 hypothetical protein E3P84_01534 [Wallemia ichthyophaga]